MDFDETVEALQTMLEVPISDEDENFLRIVPRAFEYANNRIYRDLRFLAAVTSTVGGTFTTNNREILVPPAIIVLRYFVVYTPVGAIAPTSSRTVLEHISLEALDIFWPQAGGPGQMGVPRKYALIGSGTLANPYIVRTMPTPDLNYSVEFVGPIRPLPLSQAVPTTFLSTVYPELHLAACLVFLAGYQRDFGLQVGGPQGGGSWEDQYGRLRDSALIEAGQQHGEGAQWSSFPPPAVANTPRSGA